MKLGLTPEEFYRLQARQLDALIRQDRHRREEQEFLFAQLTASVINFSMFHPEKPVNPGELMPSRMRAQPRQERMTAKRRAGIADAWRTYLRMGAKYGGTIITKEQQRSAAGNVRTNAIGGDASVRRGLL